MAFYDCSENSQLLAGLRAARGALARRELAVIPTDTVYGVAADAFSPQAVERLLAAKGRDRTSPPPVLIPNVDSLHALAATVPDAVMTLAREFWPGALTIILPAQPSLTWDLGDTAGTVALRIPQHALTLELLTDTGPLAVSSANISGEPAAETARQAEEALGDSVAVYLDDPATHSAEGSSPRLGSTIIDATAYAAGVGPLRLVRKGPISLAQLASVVGDEAFSEAPTSGASLAADGDTPEPANSTDLIEADSDTVEQLPADSSSTEENPA